MRTAGRVARHVAWARGGFMGRVTKRTEEGNEWHGEGKWRQA